MISMHQKQEAHVNLTIVVWTALSLAVLAALMYVLIAFGVLGIGKEGMASDAVVAWVLGIAGYLTGGLLILARSRKLWITGAVINGLVLFAFLKNWAGSPEVIFSPGGLATKIPQILLEVALLYLIATSPAPRHDH